MMMQIIMNCSAFADTKVLFIEVFAMHPACIFIIKFVNSISAEAGGVVTDAAGNPLDFSKGKFLDLEVGIIVTNQKLMPSLLKAVRESIEEKASSL